MSVGEFSMIFAGAIAFLVCAYVVIRFAIGDGLRDHDNWKSGKPR